MIVHTITIPYKYGDTFKLLPLSDLHYDGKGRNSICDISKLKRNLAEGVDEKTLIIGVGDWFGGILPSDVRRYRKAHDAADGEDILDHKDPKCLDINTIARKLPLPLNNARPHPPKAPAGREAFPPWQ